MPPTATRLLVVSLCILALAACTTTQESDRETSVTTTEPQATTTKALQTSTSPSTIPATTQPAEETQVGPPLVAGCRPDPFRGVSVSLASQYAGRDLTAHVYDIRTGCEYAFNPENRQPTASVFKVMVMAGTLLEAQQESRLPTEGEWNLMLTTITESANEPVRALWRSFGASPWFRETGEAFGLSDTSITADGGSAWGATRTSASDQVRLLRQVLLGEWGPLNEASRSLALELMTSVVPDQAWGITSGVPSSWTVAQKNGFAGQIINSIGWVDPPGPEEGYVVAILTYGWPDHASGIAAVEHISRLVTDAMIDSVPGAR
ncbi:MAG: hypothetical protein DWQ20_05465 [Actinobacteria bacterium]|nr:MAG: hypothetical protein DWQ20_05465 [Actinomycetota bacterium]